MNNKLATLVFTLGLLLFPLLSFGQTDTSTISSKKLQMDLGGVLQFNYNLSS